MRITTRVDISGGLMKIQGIRDRLKPGARVYTDLGRIGQQSTRQNFNAAGRDPTWPPRQQSYSHPPLDKTGQMRDAAESSWDRWEHSGNMHIVKVRTPVYGKFHQYGTSKLPVRKFVKWLQQEIEQGKIVIRRAVNG